MILDEFVLVLKLDPKQFDQAQREALEKLRSFEQASAKQSEQIADAMKGGMAAFYKAFNEGLGGVAPKVDKVGDQSRRAGEKIAAAGEASAIGFKRLTGSLLEAYAVVGTLEGAFHKLEQGAARATSTVITSMATGIAPRQLGGLAGMFPYLDYNQALGITQNITSWSALWRAGKPPQAVIDAFSRYGSIAGVQTSWGELGSPIGMMQQIATITRRLEPAMRLGFLGQLGIPSEALPEFMRNPAQILQDYNEAMARAPTQRVTDELFKLRGEVGKTEQSWLTLWETIEASGAEHGGDEALKTLNADLQKTSEWLGTTKDGVDTLRAAFTALGVAAVAAIAKIALAVAIKFPWLTALMALANLAGDTPKPGSGESKWNAQHFVPVPGAVNPETGQVVKSVAPSGAVTYYPGRAQVPSQGAAPPPGAPLSRADPAQLEDYIIKHEGGSPRGVVNNPGNIKFTGAPGQIDSGVAASDGGTFASYPTPQAGLDAIRSLIARATSGQVPAYGPNPTVGSFLSTYSGGGYGAPVFQHGGIVPIFAHGGEAVLPAELTSFLLAGARATGGGRASFSNAVHIGTLVVSTAAVDVRGISRSIRRELAREFSSRAATEVMSMNTVFE